MNDNNIILECKNINKAYHDGNTTIEVLKNFNFSLKHQERVAIVGSSGSGKTTLLHILAGLDIPDLGSVFINNKNFSDLSEKQRECVRNKEIGIVFQFHYLLPEFTAEENVAMPLLIQGVKSKDAIQRSRELLAKLGLAKRFSHKPSMLSGGERQRVAIARALVTHPSCVLADEPTGNLDPKTADIVYQQFLDLNHEYKTSFIIVTHDQKLVSGVERVLQLQN
jgi:lipoprotein-releasing system ATP-binding protein